MDINIAQLSTQMGWSVSWANIMLLLFEVTIMYL